MQSLKKQPKPVATLEKGTVNIQCPNENCSRIITYAIKHENEIFAMCECGRIVKQTVEQ